MKNLEIEGSFKLPSVSLDAGSGIMEIRGKSIPERTSELYDPILEWLDKYAENPREETVLNLMLEYCNSSSVRYVMDILGKFDHIQKSGKQVTINWYYEEDDEDMYDLGISCNGTVSVPINLLPVPER